MVDMADLAMDQAFDAWIEGADREYDPDGCEHEDSFWFSSNRKTKTKTCRFCGTKGLSWVDTKYDWRLFAGKTQLARNQQENSQESRNAMNDRTKNAMARHFMFSCPQEIVLRHKSTLEQVLKSTLDREMLSIRCGSISVKDCKRTTRLRYEQLLSVAINE